MVTEGWWGVFSWGRGVKLSGHYVTILVKNPSDNQGKICFSFELREKVLNNKNSGETQREVKYKTAVNLEYKIKYRISKKINLCGKVISSFLED